jgi:MFS family permease
MNTALDTIAIPEFRSFIFGRLFLVMALRMTATTVGWLIWQVTHSLLALSMVGLSEFLPAITLALYAGHVIDISDKRSLTIKTLVCYVGCIACFLILTTPGILHHHNIVWAVYLIVFATGVLRAFANPAISAMISQIVPRPLLGNAVNWSQSTFLGASIMGHALAGFLIGNCSYTVVFSTIAGLASLGLFFVTLLKPKPSSRAADDVISTWASVKEGLSFVYRTKEVLAAMSLDMFAVLFGGVIGVIPVFATDILKISPQAYGWLNASSDIGSGIMILSLTFFPLRMRQGKILLTAVFGFGLCIIVFALSRNFYLSFAALLVSGMMDGISVLIRGTIIQLKTPDAVKGRVLSVSSMFINSSNELGNFESGLAAKLLGIIPSVIFGGIMTLVVVGTTWFSAPRLRKMEY